MGCVATTVDDASRVMTLTLAGRNVMNPFDIAMRDDLLAGFALCRDHPDIGAVLIRSTGPNFCSGADLKEFRAPGTVLAKRWIRARRNVWREAWELPVPVVVAMRGYVFGSGFELTLLGDIRVASADAAFCLPEVKLGMLPGAAGTQSLPRTIGAAAALELITTGRGVDAATALDMGIVHRVTDDPDEMAATIAARLAALPRALSSAAKRALHAAVDPTSPTDADVRRRAAGAGTRG
ncbi:MAG TPA: enoyl-CoA hydratase/isomerase family protein [Pseudonocardiaceae bacterium]|nr:enoyl-CoA hydratase/isomerase family protein [Pseudonocardiaceae bacterium]